MSMHHASPLGKLRGAIVIICLVLILGILGFAYLSDKHTTVLDKDEILNKIEATESIDSYSYLSSYIKAYGVGNVNAYKINEAEEAINTYFYKELPTKEELAKTVVALFVEHYYDNVNLYDKNAVTDAVLNCLVYALGDPYAYYRTAPQFEDYTEDLEGGEEFVGIGVMINSETCEITMVYRDSGAYEAGIRPKDIFYGVGDKTTDDTSVDELLEMIKGEPDTTVKVKVKREGEILEFNVTRKVLTERTVTYQILDNGIGYIYISQFLGTTYTEFVEAVDYCTEMNVKALVIDVRYNPGGLLSSVVSVIDYLAPDAKDRRIGSYTQAGVEQVFYTTDGHSVNVPIAVICNEFTASAGELFTSAMRDYGDEGVLDTVIVGTTTYGKGIAQSSFYLYDNSALTFTIGYFNPPCDVNFNGEGVHPDFEVEEVAEYDLPLKCATEKVLELVGARQTASVSYRPAA